MGNSCCQKKKNKENRTSPFSNQLDNPELSKTNITGSELGKDFGHNNANFKGSRIISQESNPKEASIISIKKIEEEDIIKSKKSIEVPLGSLEPSDKDVLEHRQTSNIPQLRTKKKVIVVAKDRPETPQASPELPRKPVELKKEINNALMTTKRAESVEIAEEMEVLGEGVGSEDDAQTQNDAALKGFEEYQVAGDGWDLGEKIVKEEVAGSGGERDEFVLEELENSQKGLENLPEILRSSKVSKGSQGVKEKEIKLREVRAGSKELNTLPEIPKIAKTEKIEKSQKIDNSLPDLQSSKNSLITLTASNQSAQKQPATNQAPPNTFDTNFSSSSIFTSPSDSKLLKTPKKSTQSISSTPNLKSKSTPLVKKSNKTKKKFTKFIQKLLTTLNKEHDSKRSNFKTKLFKTGDRYNGEMKGDKMEGYGQYNWKDGSWYKGEFKSNQMHGKGIYFDSIGTQYEGQFKNGRKHGKGKYVFVNGDLYLGEYQLDKMHGKGTTLFKNGDVYEGEYQGDKRHGKGVMRTKKGDVYHGSFRNNMRSGQGRYLNAEGEMYDGEFRGDLRHGEGVLKMKTGHVYSGGWAKDKMHGEGQVSQNGELICRGLWKSNVFVGAGGFGGPNGLNVIREEDEGK